MFPNYTVQYLLVVARQYDQNSDQKKILKSALPVAVQYEYQFHDNSLRLGTKM